MLKKYYLGGFFWAPIPFKRYQNTSGFTGEYAIFNGVESLFPDVSKLWCVRHMKQRNEIKIGKLLVKFKCSGKVKVFKAKQYWREKK